MQTPPYPPPGVPPQFQGLPLQQQWMMYYAQVAQQQQQRPGGGTWASDQLAMQQVNNLIGEKSRLEATLTAERAQAATAQKATDDRITALQKDLERQRDDERKRADKAEADARETRLRADAQAREDALKAEIAKISARLDAGMQKPAESVAGPEKWAFLVPILTTYLSNQASKGEAELKRSMDMMKIMLDSQKKEPNAAEATLTKAMIDMMKLRNDEKAAGTEAQVMMLGALSNFIKDQQGPNPPWWLPMIESVVESIKAGVTTAVVASSQGPGAPAPQHLPSPQQPRGVVETHAEPVQGPPGMAPAEAAQWQGFMKENEVAAKATYMAYQSPQMPTDLKTPEWRILIFNLHCKEDPDEFAPIVADHLEHQRTFGLLPESFAAVFTEPAKAFSTVLKALPIGSMDPPYAEAFLAAIVKEITDRETERARVAREEAEEEAKEAAKAASTAPS